MVREPLKKDRDQLPTWPPPCGAWNQNHKGQGSNFPWWLLGQEACASGYLCSLTIHFLGHYLDFQGTRRALALAMRGRVQGEGCCKKCKWCGAELGSSCLALPRAGRSWRKEPQCPGAFCPGAELCERWGQGQESVELVLSWEPLLPAGVRMWGESCGLRPGKFRNGNCNSACSSV